MATCAIDQIVVAVLVPFEIVGAIDNTFAAADEAQGLAVRAEFAILVLVVEHGQPLAHVVTSGRSNRHVNAIADHVIESLHKSGVSRVRVEGMPNCDWVLIDAGDVIVHIFRPEVRAFYNLEKMWAREPAQA